MIPEKRKVVLNDVLCNNVLILHHMRCLIRICCIYGIAVIVEHSTHCCSVRPLLFNRGAAQQVLYRKTEAGYKNSGLLHKLQHCLLHQLC